MSVHIAGKGNARIDVPVLLNRTFVLLPVVTSMTPQEGSIEGGTEIIIQVRM